MAWTDRIFGRSARMQELETRVQELSEQRSIDSLPWSVGGPEEPKTPSSERALRLAPVYGAVSMIARSLSTLPIHAYRNVGSTRKRLPNLPRLLQTPSIHGDVTDWLHRLLTSLLLTGNAYGLVTARDGMGYPTMIEWLDPVQVQVLDQAMWGRGSYWDPIYYWRGRVVDREQMVHIPWFTMPFRVRGLSPLSAFAAAVDVGLEGQRFTKDWYRSGGVPPGSFKNSAKTITDSEAGQIKSRLTSAIRTHEPLVYGADWDYNPIAVSPHEANFVLTHQLSATDIAVVYGIYPAERIGGVTKTSMTYSNVEADAIQWTNVTLRPYAAKLESYLFDLLPAPQYVRFALDAEIRSDSKTRREIYQIDRNIGLRSIDEIREQEDLPALPDGQGAVYTPLITVHELIRAAAVSTGNPNVPGFQAGEPVPAGAVGGSPAAPGAPSQANGRFVGRPGELVAVAGGRSQEYEEGGLPPF